MEQDSRRNDLLKSAREKRGWTQNELAAQLNVAKRTIESWESGERKPYPAMRQRLCDLFGMSLEQLGLQQPSELAAQKPSVEEPLARTGKPPEEDTNRRKMLQKVHRHWITGVLENNLYLATLIIPGLREQPDAVENPWRLVVRESNRPPRYLPSGTRITQVYDEFGCELLIMGEPGSGKTTLMLELTRELLRRAEINDTHPIPVVFNLSEWTQKRLPLAHWLAEELNAKYQVPHQLCLKWIADNQILPLLDGLDEIDQTYSAECVEAINEYRRQHGFLPMVTCCRSENYLTQPARLLLQTAVVVMPLTAEQIEAYISEAGEGLAAVRAALQNDVILQDMASTPLMLSTLAFTYRGQPIGAILANGSPLERRRTVLKNYVERVLQYRGPEKQEYAPQQTVRYLAWLAQQMEKHNQTEFYIERLQPSWLPNGDAQYRYRNSVVQIIFGIELFVIGVLFALFRGDSFPTKPGLFFWLGGGRGNTLLGWMAPGIGGSFQGALSLEIFFILIDILVTLLIGRGKIPTLSLKAILYGIYRGVRSGLVVGGCVGIFSALIYGFIGGGAYGLFRGIGNGLFTLVGYTLVTGLMALLRFGEPQQPQSPRLHLRDRLRQAFVFCVCAMSGFGCSYALQSGGIDRIVATNTILFGFSSMLFFGFGNGTSLIRGLGGEIQPVEIAQWRGCTWQAIADNVRKGVSLGIVVMTCLMLVIIYASSTFYGLTYGLKYGTIFGLIIGFLTAMAGILAGLLRDGWSSDMLDEHQLMKPNEGIRRSLHNAVFAACLFGLIGGGISGLMCGLAFGLVGIAGWLILGTGFAIVFGGVFALQFFILQGGIAYISHYTLRYFLWRMRSLPWNYSDFLNHAAKRILLRKVGGGYIFIHRMILEYLANLAVDKE